MVRRVLILDSSKDNGRLNGVSIQKSTECPASLETVTKLASPPQ